MSDMTREQEIENLSKIISQIPLEEIIHLFYDVRVNRYDFFEKYPELEECPLEEIVCLLSTIYTNEELIEVDKHPQLIDDLYLTMLQVDNFPMNKDSILLEKYVPDIEYLVYSKKNTNQDEIKKFMDKYSFDEKINPDMDFKIAKIYYAKWNYKTFIRFIIKEEPDNYERKHYFIRKFFEVWDIYKNEIPEEDKERFFQNVIKKDFSKLNWTTMSRLYDPNDKEFMDKFSQNIDTKFAEQYHPKFKLD